MRCVRWCRLAGWCPHVGAALATRVGNAPHVVIGVVTLRALPAARDELQAGPRGRDTYGHIGERCGTARQPSAGTSLAALDRCATLVVTGTASSIGSAC